MTYWQTLLELQDSNASKISKAFLDSVKATVNNTNWQNFEMDLILGKLNQAADLIAWEDFDPTEQIAAGFAAASEANTNYILSIIKPKEAAPIATPGTPDRTIKFRYDLKDPNAEKWIRDYGASEVKAVGDSSKRAIREVVFRGFFEGYTPKQQSTFIRGMVGLTPGMAETVQNFGADLLKRGSSPAEVLASCADYSSQLIRQRADTIAYNEATEALGRGCYMTTADACNRGVLDPAKYEGYRIVTPDERLCDICRPKSGEARTLPDGIYKSSGSQIAKLHIKCRCCEGLREISIKKTDAQIISSYSPKQTTAEIMDWAKETYPDTKFFFKDCDVDAMNPTMAKLHELFQKYPDVGKRVEGFGQHGGINSYAGTILGHDKKRDAILISKSRFGDAKDLLDTLEEDVESNWHPEGTGRIDSVVTHEFGHTMERYLEANHPDEIKKFKESVAHITKWDDLPSRYARENATEAFAEGFAQINFGSDLCEYSRLQKSFLAKMFGG